MKKFILISKVALLALASLIAGATTITVYTLSFRSSSEFCRRYLIRPFMYFGLLLFRIKFRLHDSGNIEAGPCVYISNHRSVIDFFLIGALALPRTRFFLSLTNHRYWTIRMMGKAVGFFYIPRQDDPEGRIRCFREAEEVLKKSGDSVYLSVEGDEIPRYKTEKFNRGAFHLAANLGLPLSPFYIHVPESVNAGRGFDTKGGMVDIYFFPRIETKRWEIRDLDRYKNEIHDLFVDFEERIEGGKKGDGEKEK